MNATLLTIKTRHLFALCLFVSILCTASVMHGMEEELPLLDDYRGEDLETGLIDEQSSIIEDLHRQKKREWGKTLALGAASLVPIAGGGTLFLMFPNPFGQSGGMMLFLGGTAALITRIVVHVIKKKRLQSIVKYLENLGSDVHKGNDQKFFVSEELLQAIANAIQDFRPFRNNLKIIIKNYQFWKLLPTEDSIDSESRCFSLMTFLLSLKRCGYDKIVTKDIRYKIIAYCPEIICNQQLFNLAVLHMKQDAQCADFIRYCPFSWIKDYFQEKRTEDEVFSNQIATVGTILFVNTMYELLPDKDLNKQETFGTREKVETYVFDELKAILNGSSDLAF